MKTTLNPSLESILIHRILDSQTPQVSKKACSEPYSYKFKLEEKATKSSWKASRNQFFIGKVFFDAANKKIGFQVHQYL